MITDNKPITLHIWDTAGKPNKRDFFHLLHRLEKKRSFFPSTKKKEISSNEEKNRKEEKTERKTVFSSRKKKGTPVFFSGKSGSFFVFKKLLPVS